MKISDGQWLIREGLEVVLGSHVHDVEVRGRELHVLLATRDVSARAAQLDCPLLTLRVFSPRTGVVGLRLEHFQGAPEPWPAFERSSEESPEVEVRVDERQATLRSGGLTARVVRGPGGAVEILRETVSRPSSPVDRHRIRDRPRGSSRVRSRSRRRRRPARDG
jgi:alpha-D-xyloside xylohydrolase